MSVFLEVCFALVALLAIIFLVVHTVFLTTLTVIALKAYKFGKKQGQVFDLAEKLSAFLPKRKN